MRRVAIILILTFVLATPALAASQEASQEQAAAWDKVVLDYYDGKYGASEEYDQDYVNISDWVILDVDSSELEAQVREEIAVKEQELAEIERQVGELQERYDYFHSLMQSVEDEDYKKELESLVQDAEKALNDAQKEAESMQSEIQGLQEEEYLTQIAVAKAEIKFGGNVLGTMTQREDLFVNPETGEMLDAATAKEYAEVNEYLSEQPQVDQQTYHHETVGLFFLVIGLGGWWLVNRKL